MYLNHTEEFYYIYGDIEADSLTPTKIWCAVFYDFQTKIYHKCRGQEEVRRFVNEAPKNVVWVGHNFISYDGPNITRLCGTDIDLGSVVDTLVLGYLYDPQMPGGHSLKAWGERLKLPKLDWNDWSKFSEEQLEYCVRDVELGVRVFSALCGRMLRRGFSERSCRLEHEIRVIIDEQQRNGWYFDVEGAERLQARLRDSERDLGDQVHALFPPELVEQATYRYRLKADGSPYSSYGRHLEQYPKLTFNGDGSEYTTWNYEEFNIGSPAQRLDKLLSLGFVPTKKTKGGNPSVDEESLVEFAKTSGIPEVQAIADWLVVNGRANMIGTWRNNVGPDGRIHGRVMSCGAASRRMTHSAPNTANIPSNEAKYGKECRQLWTVSDPINRRVVGYDSKACQMRCFASLLPDPNVGRRFWDLEFCPDPHAENARLVGIERKPMKNVFYALMFGAMDPKLGATAGMVGTRDELAAYGGEIRSKLMAVTPGLERMIKEAEWEFDRNGGFLECIDGGFVRCPKRSAVLNYKIQPAEAVLMKTASCLISKYAKQRGIEHKKIGDIHDEGQHETSVGQARPLGEICVQAIRDAGEELGFRVPHDGDFRIGLSWAETH